VADRQWSDYMEINLEGKKGRGNPKKRWDT